MTHLTMESESHGAHGTHCPSMQDREKFLADIGAGWFLLPAIWLVLALAGLAFISYSPAQPAESSAPKVTASPFADTELGVPAASTVVKDGAADSSGHVAQF